MTKHNVMMILIMLITALFLSCSRNVTVSESQYDISVCKDSILIKKELMLAAPDTTYNFLFSDDCELEQADPHAFWLMGRMMQTVQLVHTAEDAVAWVLALNKNVTEYNHRIDRRIDDKLAEDAATMAIEHLIALYESGNQSELNTQSYVLCILEHYRTINAYIRLMRIHMDSELGELIYREYREWFDINNAANAIMTFYTYGAAHYSALPLDINYTFAVWSQERAEELKMEEEIFWSSDNLIYRSDAKRISPRKFARLIEHFHNTSAESVIEEIVSGWVKKDYEFAQEMVSGCFNFDVIHQMAGYYQAALNNWMIAREDIAASLTEDRRKSYMEMTEQIHTRLYNELKHLNEIRY